MRISSKFLHLGRTHYLLIVMADMRDVRRFAAEHGREEKYGINQRSNQTQRWKEWCEKEGIDPNPTNSAHGKMVSRMMRRNKRKKEQKKEQIMIQDENVAAVVDDSVLNPPELTNERYKEVEDVAYRQLRMAQNLLDSALLDNNIGDCKILTSTVNDSIKVYETAVKSRVSHDVLQGKFIPASIIDKYKSDFYPHIAQSVDNMRLQLLGLLPDEMKATVQAAWLQAYDVYIEGVAQAEEALNNIAEDSVDAAMNELKKSRSGINIK